MTDTEWNCPNWRRRMTGATMVVAGLAAIVGSGGGSFDEGQVCANNSCDINISIPFVFVMPARLTVQVASPVLLTSSVVDVANPTFQWQRSNNGAAFVDIPGATQSTYTLPSATLADDDTVFKVEVFSGSSAVVAANQARLSVSSMPSILLQDSDFVLGDWTAATVADNLSVGASHVEDQALSGGNPGAFRHMAFSMPAGPSDQTVVHLYRLGQYEPAAQGAIHVIDYVEDCKAVQVGAGTQYGASTRIAFQQGERVFASKLMAFCNSFSWATQAFPSLSVTDFTQLSGSACGAGESCPDFSASAPSLHLGFIRSAQQGASTPAATIDQGIDNWTVHVWRP